MSWSLKHSPPPQNDGTRGKLNLEVLEDRSVPATINGVAFYDLNHNGLQDTGEGFAAGVAAALSGSGVSANTTTDANGYFEFTGLGSGSYAVSFTPPSGYTVGTPPGGSTSVNIQNVNDTIGIGVGLIGAGSGSGSGGNAPPTFVADSSTLHLITPNQPFYFHKLADDPNDDVLTYSTANLPVGLSIDATSGIISGIPTNLPQTGQTIAFTVSVSDGRGGTAQENVTFTVTPPFTTWVINTTDDDRNNLSAASSDVNLLDGVPLDGNDKVSLRAVIEQANYNRLHGQYWPAAPVYVTFDPALNGQETVLGRSLDTIQASIVFIGRGQTQTLIAGNPAGGGYNTQGIFRFATGSESAVTGMTLETGFNSASGGAVSIANGSSVFLDSDTIRNSQALDGGAIFSDGYAATINSTITGNHATSLGAAASGGGIHVNGGYFVSSFSLFENNTGVVKGGGIAVNGTGNAFIYYTDIIGNTAPNGGGMYLSGGQRLILQNSLVSGNSATNGDGGGVIVEGRASIRETYFEDNIASGKGGAIIFKTGSLTLNGCTFGDNNSATIGGPKLAEPNGTKLTDASGNNTNFDPLMDIFWYAP